MVISTLWVNHAYITQRKEIDLSVRTSAWMIFQAALEYRSLVAAITLCRVPDSCDEKQLILRSELFSSRLDLLEHSTETDLLPFIGPYKSYIGDVNKRLSALFQRYLPDVGETAGFSGSAFAKEMEIQINDFGITIQKLLRDATIYNSNIEQRASLLSSTDPLVPFTALWVSAFALVSALLLQDHRSRRTLGELQKLRRGDLDWQQRTERLLDTLTYSIIVILTDGTIAYCNSAARQNLGVEAGEVRQSTLVADIAIACAAAGVGEISIDTPTAGLRSFNCIRSAFRWSNAEANLFALHDNSAERDAQLEALETGRLVVLGELSSSLAHELNQPLSTIRIAASNARLLLAKGALNDARTKLDRIDEQADRAASIIKGIRKLAVPSIVDGIFNLRNSIDFCISLVEQQCVVANVRIHTEFRCDGDPLVSGNATLFDVALTNLLLNARDAYGSRQDKAVVGVVQVSVECGEGKIAISVRDKAGGIDTALLPRIFETFATTKKGVGMGLGLSISRRSIEQMNGSLDADNVAGGAEFTIRLPVAA